MLKLYYYIFCLFLEKSKNVFVFFANSNNFILNNRVLEAEPEEHYYVKFVHLQRLFIFQIDSTFYALSMMTMYIYMQCLPKSVEYDKLIYSKINTIYMSSKTALSICKSI